VVGTLLYAGYGEYLNLKNGKYFFTVGFDGTFPIGQIWWSGLNCTGTPYLNDGQSGLIGTASYYTAQASYVNEPVYSAAANKLYLLSGGNSNSIALSQNMPGGSLSIENPTCMNNSPATSTPASGWPLTPTTPAAIGFSASGTPLAVATPLELP
jgi:hypothetical protein